MTIESSRWARIPHYNHYEQDPVWLAAAPGMKPQSIDWAFSRPTGKRGAFAKTVLVITAMVADPWTGECVIDELVLRRWTGAGPYALKTALRRVAELGFATSERRPDGAIRIALIGAPLGLMPDGPSGDEP